MNGDNADTYQFTSSLKNGFTFTYCQSVQFLGNKRLKICYMEIRAFVTELRTNVLVHTAHTYLYVYRDVPSQRCFSFTWHLPGCACMGQTGQVASGVLVCGHTCRQGLQALEHIHCCFLTSELHAMAGKANGACGDGCITHLCPQHEQRYSQSQQM